MARCCCSTRSASSSVSPAAATCTRSRGCPRVTTNARAWPSRATAHSSSRPDSTYAACSACPPRAASRRSPPSSATPTASPSTPTATSTSPKPPSTASSASSPPTPSNPIARASCPKEVINRFRAPASPAQSCSGGGTEEHAVRRATTVGRGAKPPSESTPLHHRRSESPHVAAREQRADEHHRNRHEIDPRHGEELVERDLHRRQAGGDRLVVLREQEHRGDHEIAGDRAEREDAGSDQHGPAHRQHDAVERGGPGRALDERRLFDLARQGLEIRRQDPDAEGQRHRRVDGQQQER